MTEVADSFGAVGLFILVLCIIVVLPGILLSVIVGRIAASKGRDGWIWGLINFMWSGGVWLPLAIIFLVGVAAKSPLLLLYGAICLILNLIPVFAVLTMKSKVAYSRRSSGPVYSQPLNQRQLYGRNLNSRPLQHRKRNSRKVPRRRFRSQLASRN
jgi:hypothetical protein